MPGCGDAGPDIRRIPFGEDCGYFAVTGNSRDAVSLKLGDRMEDDTIYTGISPDTGRPMYTMPADGPLTMQWNKAMDYAAGLDAYGHRDWRVPSRKELNMLWHNREKGALKGTFNVTMYP